VPFQGELEGALWLCHTLTGSTGLKTCRQPPAAREVEFLATKLGARRPCYGLIRYPAGRDQDES
jgi:hypothetical protein